MQILESVLKFTSGNDIPLNAKTGQLTLLEHFDAKYI